MDFQEGSPGRREKREIGPLPGEEGAGRNDHEIKIGEVGLGNGLPSISLGPLSPVPLSQEQERESARRSPRRSPRRSTLNLEEIPPFITSSMKQRNTQQQKDYKGRWRGSLLPRRERNSQRYVPSLRAKLQFYAQEYELYAKLEAANVILSIASCLLYLVEVYNEEEREDKLMLFLIAGIILNIFFLVDFAISLLMNQYPSDYLLSVAGLVDFITSVPFFLYLVVCLVHETPLLSLLLPLRVMKAVSVLRILRVYRNFMRQREETVEHYQIPLMAASLLSLVFCATGIFQAVETEWYLRERGEALSFHEALYFMIVTLGTVGYGDISPHTLWGKMLTITLVLGIIIILPHQIAQLVSMTSKHHSYEKRYVVRKNQRAYDGHVVLSGCITADSLNSFLHEFTSSLRGLNRLHVVVMGVHPPSAALKRVLRKPKYHNRCTYIRGSLIHEEDIDRCQLKEAQAAFILANTHSSNPEREDAATIMRALAVRNFLECLGLTVPLYVQLLQAESKPSVFNIIGVDRAVFTSKLKYSMLALSTKCPGACALITNLIRSYDTKHKSKKKRQERHSWGLSSLIPSFLPFTPRSLGGNAKNMPAKEGKTTSWATEYMHGIGFQIYPMILNAQFNGEIYAQVASALYKHYGAILLGVYRSGSVSSSSYVDLGSLSCVLREGDLCFLIASDVFVVHKILETYDKRSFTPRNILLAKRGTGDKDIENLDGANGFRPLGTDEERLPAERGRDAHTFRAGEGRQVAVEGKRRSLLQLQRPRSRSSERWAVVNKDTILKQKSPQKGGLNGKSSRTNLLTLLDAPELEALAQYRQERERGRKADGGKGDGEKREEGGLAIGGEREKEEDDRNAVPVTDLDQLTTETNPAEGYGGRKRKIEFSLPFSSLPSFTDKTQTDGVVRRGAGEQDFLVLLERQTVSNVVGMRGHVVICGATTHLSQYLKVLRHYSSVSPPRGAGVTGEKDVDRASLPIVILHSSPMTQRQWESLGPMRENVYFVKGSQLVYSDLVRAAVPDASYVIILASLTVSSQGQESEREDGYLVDYDNIMSLLSIEDVHSQYTDTHYDSIISGPITKHIVELKHPRNMRFCLPLPKGDTSSRAHHFYLSPSFAAGRVFLSLQLDSLICQAFFNPYIIRIITTLAEGVPAGWEGSTADVRSLMQIPLLASQVGRKYEELFDSLLFDWSILGLGLYRAPSRERENQIPYVYTCPLPETVLETEDLVFVLSSTKAYKDYMAAMQP